MKRTLLTFFGVVSLFFITLLLVSANESGVGISLWKNDPSGGYTPLAAPNNTAFNRGESVLVEIHRGSDPIKNFRQIGIFAPQKDTPENAYHVVTLYKEQDICVINIPDDGGRGIWKFGKEIYGGVFTGSEQPEFCEGSNQIFLDLTPDQFFHCGPNGSTCTIRMSKDGVSLTKPDGSALSSSDLENATTAQASFRLNDLSQNPNGLAPNVILSSNAVTSGDQIIATVSSLDPDQDYDVLVSFKDSTDPTHNFGSGTIHATCNRDKAFTGSGAFGDALKKATVTGVTGCLNNEYFISISTTNYMCGAETGNPPCEIRVQKHSGGDIGKAEFTASTSKVAFHSPANNSSVKWGAKQTIRIIKIPKMTSGNAKYTVTVKDSQSNEKGKYNFEIKNGGTTAAGCEVKGVSTSDTTDKLFIYSSPAGEPSSCYFNTNAGATKDTFSNDVVLNTTRLSKPQGNTTYTLTLSADNKSILPQPITTQFTLTSASDIIMKPESEYTGDAIDSANYAYEFFEGSKVKISVRGCPVGTKVDAYWWRGEDDVKTAKGISKNLPSSNSDATDEADDSKKDLVVGADGIAPFPSLHDFGNSGKNEPYLMRAWCKADSKSGVAAEVNFRVWGEGEEFITVPVVIRASEPFDMTVGGLENGECYYILLQNTDTHEPVTGAGGSIETCSDDAEGKIDPPKHDKIFAKSNKWAPSASVSVPSGLQSGNYRATLYIPNNREGGVGLWDNCNTYQNDECDDHKAERDFCVDVCRNDGQAFPPGKAPCLIGRDIDDKLIDARPPTDIDNDGVYKDAVQGTRDQIITCTVVPTAFGNIDTSPQGIVKSLLQILLSAAGGIALILILIAAYKIMTSRGNPEQIQDGKEQITSAIVGLLFIIFSVVILQTIGVDLLRIPGFKP